MKETLYGKTMGKFVAFCETHEITHIHEVSIPFCIFNAEKMEFFLARQMIQSCNDYLCSGKKILLDIRMLGARNVRAFVAYSLKDSKNDFGTWYYGFGIGNGLVALDKKIVIDGNVNGAVAVEIIAEELRDFAIKYIKRKPYILLKPSVLKAISLC